MRQSGPGLTRQEGAAEHRPERDAQAQGFGHGHEFAVGVALGGAVLDLDAGERRIAFQLRQQRTPRQTPGGKVRKADVKHLPGRDQVVHPTQDLLHGRHRIVAMQPEDVDVICLQALQAAVDGGHHRLAAIAAHRVGFRPIDADRIFGAQYEAVASRFDELADDLLGLAGLVAGARVDEVPPGVSEGGQHATRILRRNSIGKGRAEVAAA